MKATTSSTTSCSVPASRHCWEFCSHQATKLRRLRSKPWAWMTSESGLRFTAESSTIRPTFSGYNSAYTAPRKVP